MVLFSAAVGRSEILFIDLNDAPEEILACQQNAERPEEVHVLTKRNGQPVNASTLDAYITNLEENDIPIDTVILSAHNGYGLYTGAEKKNILSLGQIKRIAARHPQFHNQRKIMVEAACYTGNARGCEDHWDTDQLGVSSVIGYPLQAFAKTNPEGQRVLAMMCRPENRKEALGISSFGEMCRFQKDLNLVANLSDRKVSVCTQHGVANEAYGKDRCYTYNQLHAMCANFDPGKRLKRKYLCYFRADPGCANPPSPEAARIDEDANDLREYYNQRQLFSHCPNLSNEPDLSVIVRLIHFDNIKNNIARSNARELADFDSRLHDLGLDQYALGDIRQLSRAELKGKIEGAANELERSYRARVKVPHVDAYGREINGEKTDARIAYQMSLGIQETLIDLVSESGEELECSHFTSIHLAKRPKRSECVMSYEEASQL